MERREPNKICKVDPKVADIVMLYSTFENWILFSKNCNCITYLCSLARHTIFETVTVQHTHKLEIILYALLRHHCLPWLTWYANCFVYRYIFDGKLGITIPFGLYMATKMWMYFTWFFYTLPYIDSNLTHLAFFMNTALLMYHFNMSVTCDPGYLTPSRKDQYEVP